jgi:hypothetical protein
MFKIFSTIFVDLIYKMQRLEVSVAVRPIYRSLGVKGLNGDFTSSFITRMLIAELQRIRNIPFPSC